MDVVARRYGDKLSITIPVADITELINTHYDGYIQVVKINQFIETLTAKLQIDCVMRDLIIELVTHMLQENPEIFNPDWQDEQTSDD